MRGLAAARIGALLVGAAAAIGLARAGTARDDREERAGLEHVAPSHGLRFERPGKGWTLQESVDSSEILSIVVRPGDATMLDAATSTIQIGIRAKPIDEATTLDFLLEKAHERIGGTPGYVHVKSERIEVGSEPAIAIVVDIPVLEDFFRLRQVYVLHSGFLFELGFHAPRKGFDREVRAFDRLLESVRFSEIPDRTKQGRALQVLAARCGSEIGWAASWEAAAKRARDEGRPVLVIVQYYPGFKISDQSASGPFMDPDIVDLMRARFVGLRLSKGMEAPFLAQEVYGMSETTFGSALLVVQPDGTVLGNCFTFQVDAVMDFLVRELAEHPEFSGSAERRFGEELARYELRRGELDRAAELLREASTAEELRLRAAIARRQRDGDQALADLGNARERGGERVEPEVAGDEARILLGLGRYEEAEKKLAGILEKHPKSPRVPEAMYWLGSLHLRTEGPDAAEATWRELIDAHPEDRWAWRAAAKLVGTGFSIGLGDRLDWPPEEILEVVRNRRFDSLPVAEARRAEREAVDYLLAQQRSDGSWISPSEVGRFSDRDPDHPFTVAITAICAQSLIRFRERPKAAAAVRRAVEYLLESRKSGPPDRAFFMDYTVWRDAYLAWFFADCVSAGIAPREKLAPVLLDLVEGLASKQTKGGGWSYYVTGDLAAASGAPPNISMSFVTAAVLVSLGEVKRAGIEVPDAVTSRALDLLVSMRSEGGTFEYMVNPDTGVKLPPKHGPGAAGRGPLCALALHRWGRADLDGIRRALDFFVEHRASYTRERGKALMHAGLDGQGSHYLMFDYAFAAAALRALPDGERSKYRDALIEQLLTGRRSDASYLDNPTIGPHYATAMALIAFDALTPLPGR